MKNYTDYWELVDLLWLDIGIKGCWLPEAMSSPLLLPVPDAPLSEVVWSIEPPVIPPPLPEPTEYATPPPVEASDGVELRRCTLLSISMDPATIASPSFTVPNED